MLILTSKRRIIVKNISSSTLLVFLLAGIFLVGCATMPPFSSQPPFSPQKIDMTAYQAKVDNFVIILDGSASMDTYHQGSTRFEEAKAIVYRLNASLPNLDLKAGLRTFGHDPSVSEYNSVGMYGITTYRKAGLQAGLNKLSKAGGNSPLSSAIDAVNYDLQSVAGKTAVIIISDGKDLGNGPFAAATRLKKAYGDRLCIYTIAVGSKPGKFNHLDKLAEAGGCGYATRAEDIASGAGMAGFVRNVFLMEQQDDDGDGVRNNQDQCPQTPSGVAVDDDGCPLDSDMDGVADYLDNCPGTPQGVSVDANGCPPDADKDGVADYLDRCPGTPAGVDVDVDGCPPDLDRDGVADYRDNCPGTPISASVDQNGCALDSDNDGVADYLDNCPGTPQGESVDAIGCPLPKATESATVTDSGTWLYEDIQFDTGSAAIKSASLPVLAEIATALKENPDLKVEIQGHTDSAGNLAYNNRLSANRAEAVREHLIKQGVNPNQLTSVGYGPSLPLVSNETAEGRARNRRVELKPMQ
jgi:OOP family OmpA-OmpF porin